MRNTPLISIITVNLNNLEGLKKTMKSVFDQTWQGFEFIIIDGGSTDGSKEYIESNRQQIHYWNSEMDTGIYNGMNKGINVAKGEYLLFLNSGDWLYENNILSQIVLDIKDIDVLYGNILNVYSDGTKQINTGVNGQEITLKTFLDGTLNHCASFINKNLFDKYGLYDENLKIVSDWKFFLISLGMNKSKVKYVNKIISCFDMTGISNYNNELLVRERMQVIREEVPYPIYADYFKYKEQEKILNSPRIQKFIITDNLKFSRKLHSIIFRIFK